MGATAGKSYNTLLQLGTVLPGLPGPWYTAPEPGMDCNAVCAKLGGIFDPVASQHNGTLVGSYFFPDNYDVTTYQRFAVECSTGWSNYGSNGEVPTGSEKSDDCYVHCACSDVPDPTLPINFQDSSFPLDEWLGDNGAPFGDRVTCAFCSNQELVRYGWRCGNSEGTYGVDRGGPEPARRLSLEGDYSEIERTGVIVDESGSCPEEEWNLEVPSGNYEVQVVIQDVSRDTNATGCTLEGFPLGLAVVPAGDAYTATLNVSVTDGNITFAGSASSGCEFINRIIVKRFRRRAQMTVALAGDYQQIVEANGKGSFLAACSATLYPVECDDVREGSIVLTLALNDNDPYLEEVVRQVERDGLALQGFPVLAGLTTGECSGVNPEDLNGGGQCFLQSNGEENCEVFVYDTGDMTCGEWCRGQGRTALTEGWQCVGSWEHAENRADPTFVPQRRRLTSNLPIRTECIPGYPLGCDLPSGFDHLICRCEDRSPVKEVRELADKTLEALLANFSDVSGTSIRAENDNAIVLATVLTAEAAEAAGGSLTVSINGTLVVVEVPASAISKLGGIGVLLVCAYSSSSMGNVENETLLDRRNMAVPFLGRPVSVQLATEADGVVEVEDLPDPISITVPRQAIGGVSWDCGYYDEGVSRWTTEGVDVSSRGSESLVCTTRHLTLFAAIGEPFIDALRCSNWNLLSMEGIDLITQGTWAYEPAALFFWLVCLFHGCLFAGALRTDLRTRREGRWTDRDFLRVQPPLGAAPEPRSKGPGRTAADGSATERAQEKTQWLPKKGEFSPWLRARVNAYCIKQIVSYRMWISPCVMEPLLEWLKQEEEEDGTVVSAATTRCTSGALTKEPSEQTTTTATLSERTTTRSGDLQLGVHSETLATGRSRSKTPSGHGPAEPPGAHRAPEPAASADLQLGVHSETAPTGRSRSKTPSGGGPPAGAALTASRPTAAAGPAAVVMGRTVEGNLSEAPSRSDPSLRGMLRTPQREDAGSGRGVGMPAADEDEPPPAKREAGMRALARPLKEELEKHHEEYFALRSSHRYAAGLLFFGLQPWLCLYRYSIFDSAMVRTLHLTAEVFGAMMFAALFFGLDAVHVAAPSGCDDAGSWAEGLWSELAAAVLGILLALIPACGLKRLGRRDFMELQDSCAIKVQIWWWRAMDVVMWILGVAYVAFSAFFTVLFLSNTKLDSGLSFVTASLIEEAIVVMLVPATVSVAFLILDVASELKEEDYQRAKAQLGLPVVQEKQPPQQQSPWKREGAWKNELSSSRISI